MVRVGAYRFPAQGQGRFTRACSISRVGKGTAEQEGDVRPFWRGRDDLPHRLLHVDHIPGLNGQHLKGKTLIVLRGKITDAHDASSRWSSTSSKNLCPGDRNHAHLRGRRRSLRAELTISARRGGSSIGCWSYDQCDGQAPGNRTTPSCDPRVVRRLRRTGPTPRSGTGEPFTEAGGRRPKDEMTSRFALPRTARRGCRSSTSHRASSSSSTEVPT